MKKMLVSQHNDVEGPGLIADWAKENGYEIEILRPDQGDNLKSIRPDQFDFLVVMGGDQSVADTDGWIYDERDLIKRAMNAQLPVAGICLGAQQIALAKGALITNSPVHEVGIFPLQVSATNPVTQGDEITVFHFHGQQFTMPANSVRLFSTPIDHNQGFLLHDNVLGLQFHLEMTTAELKKLAEFEADTPHAPNEVQETMAQVAQDQIPADDKKVLFDLLDHINR